jgi:quinolinate synthase
VTAEELRTLKREHPQAAVVCYINTSAAVKAESDICCTSSNAVKVIQSLTEEEIIFVPDKNLGSYVAKKVPEKRMIIWDGFCVTHHRVTLEEVQKAKEAHPDAVILVHPECRREVVELADFIGSTRQIIDFAAASKEKKFIIGTEMGVLYSLKKNSPEKTFYLLSQGLICPNMKKTRLESVYTALTEMHYAIELEQEIMSKARTTLERMLKVE